MTRRIWIGSIAAGAGVLALGAGTVTAAPTKTTTTHVRCVIAAVTAVPKGQTAVDPAASRGTQYGHAACGRPLGQGVQTNRFTVMPSGDLQGPYRAYFSGGTIRGIFDLAPGDTPPPSPTTFNSASYAGRITVVGGTGQFRQAKGTGTMRCASTDGVHFSCTERLTLKST